MLPQRSTRKLVFSERVISALTDLAAFSRRTSTLRFAPPETREQLATLLVQRLVALCDAQQGALFLSGPAVTQGAFANQPALVFLASTQIREEEARAALATYPPVAAPLQWSLDFPPTLVWRRSLEPSLAQRDSAESHLTTRSSALLLFGWSDTADAAQKTAFRFRDESMTLLPFLGDAVDTILLQLLQGKYEEEPSVELLPAELLATVGHEFRGPLATISGYAATLLRHDQQLSPEERQDFLGAISEASAHLGTLVDRFLELAQLETETATFTPAAVDLVALAHEAITAARQRNSHAHILLPSAAHLAEESAKKPPSMGKLTVSGDRRWLRTMLDVLLENAIAHSEPARLIEVQIEPIDPTCLPLASGSPPGSGPHVALILPGAFGEHEAVLEIQVRDQGRGIAPEHLAHIFQRFYRVDTRLTREVNGLGLGLALCKAIVARHRGMLWVESTLGEGSTFHIVLPRERTATSHLRH